MKVHILDVSLRDGGHRNQFKFSPESSCYLLKAIDDSGIDCIEIGYRNGFLSPGNALGVAGRCDVAYLQHCRSVVHNAELAVMAHPDNINENDLKEIQAAGIELLRLCVSRGQAQEVYPLIELAQDRGLKVSVNLIHISQYTRQELDPLMETLISATPDIIYFADSNESLSPAQVTALYTRYTNNTSIPLGFHPHDNLGLAQTNALAAIEAGASYIDASLAGIGKGTGNLKTEFICACFNAMDTRKFLLQPLLKASNYICKDLGLSQQPLIMGEFIRGLQDLSTAQLKALPKHSYE